MISPKIMIVEDDSDIRENLRIVLEEAGFRVTEARNGQEALDLLHNEKEEPRLIFLDLMLPVMGGRKFIAALSGIPHLKHIPVVVLTASAENFEHKTAGFMKKPLDIDEIIKVARKNTVEMNELGQRSP